MTIPHRRSVLLVAAFTIVLGLFAAPARAATGSTAAQAAQQPAAPQPVTAGALPTPQTDGTVYAIAIVGDTVYVGGKFDTARPAGVAPGGAGEVTRHNLLAFDLATGELLPWAPEVSGSRFSGPDPGPYCSSSGAGWVCDSVFRIKASPDGSALYVAGDFDKIDGAWHSRIARFDTATDALDTSFAPQVAGRVRGLSVTPDAVYLGGAFTGVNGVARTRLAAITPGGEVLDWAPSADGEVFAVLAAPQQGMVLVGGAFDHVNGAAHHGLMEVDSASGENSPWSVRLPGTVSVVTDIESDGAGTAYLGAYNWGDGMPRYEGRAAIDIAAGSARWFDGCLGDTLAVTVSDGVLYSASHTHACGTFGLPEDDPYGYQRLLAESTKALDTSPVDVNGVGKGDPIPLLLPWFPNTNGGPSDSPFKDGPWAMDSDGSYLVVGGEFTSVNGDTQQGLTRFAARGVPGAVNNGPQYPFHPPTVDRDAKGRATVTWTGTWDAQNDEITYDVHRIGEADPVYSVTKSSRPWELPEMSFTDSTAPRSGQVSYWISAVDADGVDIGSPVGSVG